MSTGSPDLNELERRALDAARSVQRHAHAPYSRKQVGASVITSSGAIFSGCNVENAANDLTVCAERNAIAAAIAAGDGKVETVIVVAPDERLWPPCESCRRVIGEFAPQARIVMSTRSGLLRAHRLDRLGSRPFAADEAGEGI